MVVSLWFVFIAAETEIFLLMCLSSLVTVFLRVSSNVRIDAANF